MSARLSLLLVLLAIAGGAAARQAGDPRSWSLDARQYKAAPTIELEPVDPVALLEEDARAVGKFKGGRALRFAVARPVSVSPQRQGAWTRLPDGASLWQARVRVPGGLANPPQTVDGSDRPLLIFSDGFEPP